MLDVRTKIHESTDFISRDPSQASFVSTTSFEVLTKIFLVQRTQCVTDTQNICLTHKSWALSEKRLVKVDDSLVKCWQMHVLWGQGLLGKFVVITGDLWFAVHISIVQRRKKWTCLVSSRCFACLWLLSKDGSFHSWQGFSVWMSGG